MSFRKRNRIKHGHDDMIMLTKSNDEEIKKNLKIRYDNDYIYTYIGEVLIAVNPFKNLHIYGSDYIDKYTGCNMNENDPHIYAIGDDMYKNLMVDKEHQCVIISGESGAGKTVNAKFIMEYLSEVSGGIGDIERVKEIIMSTNPLLEAFGNAKTVRNNNSSRFGKYFTIKFDYGGQPIGGDISSFLLEKTRVSGMQEGERNFHIFYQIIQGLGARGEKDQYGLFDPTDYHYLNMSGTFEADGIDDLNEFQDMEKALNIVGISDENISNIYMILSGILHLGNCQFEDSGRSDGGASIRDPQSSNAISQTLQVDEQMIEKALTTRKVTIGREVLESTLNVVQAENARNSLAQGIYERLFDYLVEKVNKTLKIPSTQTLNIGVLDIYGFEIFNNNGFEQLCINFVNEKLQQIFIELTLKAEQEEYQREGIQWTEIPYKNNLPVCELIEGIRPVGIFGHMDDVTKKCNAMDTDKVDAQIKDSIVSSCTGPYLSGQGNNFVIRHYAGQVTYNPSGFFEKNRNTLFQDLILTMQNSRIKFLADLFNNPTDRLISHPQQQQGAKKTPPTAGKKIKTQANRLVKTLTECRPHYVRCIKPNETKRPKDWEADRCLHQIKYLGLAENVRVRRAGFAYRRTADQFLQRYNILMYMQNPEQAQPPIKFNQDPNRAIQSMQAIMNNVGLSSSEWQFGNTKIFIKSPESVDLLENQRERLYDSFARTIQKHLKNWINKQKSGEIKQECSNVVFNRKDRNRSSQHRRHYGDYIGIDKHPEFKQFMPGKKERVIFAHHVTKYDGKMNAYDRHLIMSPKRIQMLALVPIDPKNKNPGPNDVKLDVTFEVHFDQLKEIYVSTKQDGFLLIKDTWTDPKDPAKADCLLQMRFLTEFLFLLVKKTSKGPNWINPIYTDNMEFNIKKPTKFLEKLTALTDKRVRFLNFDFRTDMMAKCDIQKGKKHYFTVLVPRGIKKDERIDHSEDFAIQESQFAGGRNVPANPYASQANNFNSPMASTMQHSTVGQANWKDFQRGNFPNRPSVKKSMKKQPSVSPANPINIQKTTPITVKPAAHMASSRANDLRSMLGGKSGGFNKPANTASQLSALSLGGSMYGSPASVNSQPIYEDPSNIEPNYVTNTKRQGAGYAVQSTQYKAPAQNNTHHAMGGVPMFGMPMTGINNQPVAEQEVKKVKPPKPPAPKNRVVKKCQALYDYQAQDQDELTIQTGDIIVVNKIVDDGWWTGTLNGRSGCFPGNYVELIKQ